MSKKEDKALKRPADGGLLEIGSAALPPGHSLRLLRPNAAADGVFTKRVKTIQLYYNYAFVCASASSM